MAISTFISEWLCTPLLTCHYISLIQSDLWLVTNHVTCVLFLVQQWFCLSYLPAISPTAWQPSYKVKFGSRMIKSAFAGIVMSSHEIFSCHYLHQAYRVSAKTTNESQLCAASICFTWSGNQSHVHLRVIGIRLSKTWVFCYSAKS